MQLKDCSTELRMKNWDLWLTLINIVTLQKQFKRHHPQGLSVYVAQENQQHHKSRGSESIAVKNTKNTKKE
jgi:hypothetical protein